MKRIGILTAGGDTPALNATIAGAVHRANQLRVEVSGIIKGFSGLLNPAGPPRPPQPALPLDPRARRRRGAGRSSAPRATTSTPTTPRRSPGWPIASDGSRSTGCLRRRRRHAQRHAAAEQPPPRRPDPQDDRQRPRAELPRRGRPSGIREPAEGPRGYVEQEAARARLQPRRDGQLRDARLRHRGLRLGAERPADPDHGREPPPDRDHRGHGPRLGHDRPGDRLRPARHHPRPRVARRPRPAGRARAGDPRQPEARRALRLRGDRRRRGAHPRRRHRQQGPGRQLRYYSGAAEAIKRLLVERLGDAFFTRKRRNESADAAIFVRKVGHTQRGGRPILFDRFYASQLGGKAVDLLLQGAAQLRGHPPVPRRRASPSTASTPTSSATAGGSSTPAPSRRPSTTPSGSCPRPRGSNTCGPSSPTPSASTTSSRSATSSTPGT